MVHLDSTLDLGLLERWKDALDASGIAFFLRNEYLAAAWPEAVGARVVEVWLEYDEDLPKAKQILHDLETLPSQNLTAWTCANCAEPIEAQFDVCWKCGAERG